MNGYKEPSFQDRQSIARGAKEKALAQLLSRPVIDPSKVAQRLDAQAKKNEALANKRAAVQLTNVSRIAAKKAAAALKLQDNSTKEQDLEKKSLQTDMELKAARDKRYAARKARKG